MSFLKLVASEILASNMAKHYITRAGLTFQGDFPPILHQKLLTLAYTGESSFTWWLLLLLGKLGELPTHHLTEFLEAFHELFVLSVALQCFLWLLLKHVNSLHVLRVAKQSVDLLVGCHVVQKIICHPLVPCAA